MQQEHRLGRTNHDTKNGISDPLGSRHLVVVPLDLLKCFTEKI